MFNICSYLLYCNYVMWCHQYAIYFGVSSNPVNYISYSYVTLVCSYWFYSPCDLRDTCLREMQTSNHNIQYLLIISEEKLW